MKLKILTITALLASSFASYAMNETKEATIKMPKADILTARLDKLGMSHFMGTTDIIEQLADQEKYPNHVASAIERCLYNYNEYMAKGDPTMARVTVQRMRVYKPLIFEALLEEHPEALRKLEKDGRVYNEPSKE